MRRLVIAVLAALPLASAWAAPPGPSASVSYPTSSPLCAAAIPPPDLKQPALGSASAPDPKNLALPVQGFFPVSSAPMPRASADTPIEVRLTMAGKKKLGEHLNAAISIANRGTKALSVLKPMDGSADHMRWPWYEIYARDEATQKVYRWTSVGMRCGNVNASKSEDHVKLAPGAESKIDLAEWGGNLLRSSLAKPGKYTVWVVYAFCGYDCQGLPLGPNVVRTDAHVGVHASNGVLVAVQ